MSVTARSVIRTGSATYELRREQQLQPLVEAPSLEVYHKIGTAFYWPREFLTFPEVQAITKAPPARIIRLDTNDMEEADARFLERLLRKLFQGTPGMLKGTRSNDPGTRDFSLVRDAAVTELSVRHALCSSFAKALPRTRERAVALLTAHPTAIHAIATVPLVVNATVTIDSPLTALAETLINTPLDTDSPGMDPFEIDDVF